MKRKKIKYFLIPLGIIVILIVIYFGSELLAIYKLGLTEVYIAKYSLPSRTLIDEDNLELIKIPRAYLNENSYIDKDDIVGKYVCYNAFIPKGSLFYKDSIDDVESMKDYVHLNLKNNEVTYDLFVKDIKVNPAHLLKGMNVNLYLTINKNEIVSDLLISNAKIIGLYDVDNKEIKENDSKLQTISIALNSEYVPYLNKAITIGEVNLLVGSNVYDESECKLNKDSILMNYFLIK